MVWFLLTITFALSRKPFSSRRIPYLCWTTPCGQKSHSRGVYLIKMLKSHALLHSRESTLIPNGTRLREASGSRQTRGCSVVQPLEPIGSLVKKIGIYRLCSNPKPQHRVGNGARKSVIFVLAQKCGWKSVRGFFIAKWPCGTFMKHYQNVDPWKEMWERWQGRSGLWMVQWWIPRYLLPSPEPFSQRTAPEPA